jgi:hypothetical protein
MTTPFSDIKRIAIREYLRNLGILPKSENSYGGMYISPLRDEAVPSFKVDYGRNLWYDHGSGNGGSIIDLVMLMERCSVTQAISKLENRASLSFHRDVPAPVALAPSIRITSVVPLANRLLSDYLANKRSLDLDIARMYCQEVHYSIDGKKYFAVGFRNDAGGWELRNEYFKGGVSPKTVTTVRNGSDTVMVFDGFMDFLSYLTLKHTTQPPIDAVVLNSTVNLRQAIPFLCEHRTINTFLDNDDAGRKTLDSLRESLPGSEVVDQSPFYRNHKDLNDYLCARRRQGVKPSVVAGHKGRKL